MPYVSPLMLIGLVGVAWAMVRFMMRHVFLWGVNEPRRAYGPLMAAPGDKLLVLCDKTSDILGRIPDTSRLDLDPIAQSDSPTAAWAQAKGHIGNLKPGHVVVITDLDSDLENTAATHTKLTLVEELVHDPARTIVALSRNPPAVLRSSLRPDQHEPDRARWTRLLNEVIVVDQRGAPGAVSSQSRSEWWRWIRAAGDHDSNNELLAELHNEGRLDGFVWCICEDIRNTPAFLSNELSRDQVLDEIDERTSDYYQALWDRCSDDEKVVLASVARHGLVNAASRRIVRRLLMRRLLTKDPDLRMMNRTFRRFVLGPARLRQVAQLEGLAEPSTWDRLRLPLALGAIAAAAFLFTTQRDMFNQTLAALAGLAAAVPAVIRVVSVVAGRGAGANVSDANV